MQEAILETIARCSAAMRTLLAVTNIAVIYSLF